MLSAAVSPVPAKLFVPSRNGQYMPEQTQNGATKHMLTFDVGGRRETISKSCLQRCPTKLSQAVCSGFIPASLQSRIWKLEDALSPASTYYVESDSFFFRLLLNGFRSNGQLHIPHHMCAQNVKRELDIWGIPQTFLANCCSRQFFSCLEEADALALTQKGSEVDAKPHSQRWRNALWLFLMHPRRSNAATAFAAFSVFVTFFSLTILALGTVEGLRQSSVAPSIRINRTTVSTTNRTNITSGSNTTTLTTSPSIRTSALPPSTLPTSTVSTASPNNSSGSGGHYWNYYYNDYYDEEEYEHDHLMRNKDFQMLSTKMQTYLSTEPVDVIRYLQYLCLIFFNMELILRVIASPSILHVFKSFDGWVDVLTVIPLDVQVVVELALRHSTPSNPVRLHNIVLVLGVLGSFRVLRILQAHRIYRGLEVLLWALKASVREAVLLWVLVSVAVIIFGNLFFFLEVSSSKSYFNNVPEGFWCALITMTTVGYGDTYPVTIQGRLVAVVCAVFGMLIIVMPVPIIASNFNLYYNHFKAQDQQKRNKNAPLGQGDSRN